MSPNHKLSVRPFIEGGSTISTVGYRDVSSGMPMASIAVPAELIERSVLANISIEVALSGAGEVSSVASGVASACFSASKTVPLDDLIETLLARNNLHMDETTAEELRTLLVRLQKSVHAVQHAIAVLTPGMS